MRAETPHVSPIGINAAPTKNVITEMFRYNWPYPNATATRPLPTIGATQLALAKF